MLCSLAARALIPARILPSITIRSPIRPYLPRLFSTQPPPPDKKTLYSYEKEGPSIDFKDDFVTQDQGMKFEFILKFSHVFSSNKLK
jgi:hypothetical protein